MEIIRKNFFMGSGVGLVSSSSAIVTKCDTILYGVTVQRWRLQDLFLQMPFREYSTSVIRVECFITYMVWECSFLCAHTCMESDVQKCNNIKNNCY